jgi:hypothetical protein
LALVYFYGRRKFTYCPLFANLSPKYHETSIVLKEKAKLTRKKKIGREEINFSKTIQHYNMENISFMGRIYYIT